MWTKQRVLSSWFHSKIVHFFKLNFCYIHRSVHAFFIVDQLNSIEVYREHYFQSNVFPHCSDKDLDQIHQQMKCRGCTWYANVHNLQFWHSWKKHFSDGGWQSNWEINCLASIFARPNLFQPYQHRNSSLSSEHKSFVLESGNRSSHDRYKRKYHEVLIFWPILAWESRRRSSR